MKTQEILSIEPSTHILESLRNTDIDAPEGICELVDNSLDAGATKIDITVNDHIKVSDNGKGCLDMHSMLTLGCHNPSDTTRLGKYGVGMKNAAVALGETMFIRSVSNGVGAESNVSWNSEITRTWRAVVDRFDTTDENGTTIQIGELCNDRVYPQSTRKRIAFTFEPALSEGKKINLNGHPVCKWIAPEIIEPKTITRSHPEYPELGYRLTFGTVEHNQGNSFLISFEHRIICQTTRPCKELSSSSRFMARVEIFESHRNGKRWEILKHKDGLKDSDTTRWLYDELNEDCAELLSKLESEGERIELQEVASIIDAAISEIIGQAKRPRKGGANGKVDPVNTPRKTREAQSVAGDGEVRKRNGGQQKGRRSGIILQYDNIGGDIIGKVDANEDRTCIILNDKHGHIVRARAARDMDTLTLIAIGLYSDHAAHTDPQARLPFANENDVPSFAEIWGRILVRKTVIANTGGAEGQ